MVMTTRATPQRCAARLRPPQPAFAQRSPLSPIAAARSRQAAELRGRASEGVCKRANLIRLVNLTSSCSRRRRSQAAVMAAAEERVLLQLGWGGGDRKGLIALSGTLSVDADPAKPPASDDAASQGPRPGDAARPSVRAAVRTVDLLVLDLDGTMLNSASAVTPGVRDAIVAVRRAGVEVVIATGKARRPAAKGLACSCFPLTRPLPCRPGPAQSARCPAADCPARCGRISAPIHCVALSAWHSDPIPVRF